MTRESPNGRWSDPRHTFESLERTKRPLGGAVLDDARSQGRTDSWQPKQILSGGTIDVDSLVGTEWTGKALSAASYRVDVGPMFTAGPVSNRAGGNRSLTEIANASSGQCNAQQRGRSATIVG